MVRGYFWRLARANQAAVRVITGEAHIQKPTGDDKSQTRRGEIGELRKWCGQEIVYILQGPIMCPVPPLPALVVIVLFPGILSFNKSQPLPRTGLDGLLGALRFRLRLTSASAKKPDHFRRLSSRSCFQCTSEGALGIVDLLVASHGLFFQTTEHPAAPVSRRNASVTIISPRGPLHHTLGSTSSSCNSSAPGVSGASSSTVLSTLPSICGVKIFE